MKKLSWIVLSLLMACGSTALAQTQQQSLSSREVVEESLARCEKQLMDIAEAMPANKYSFAPSQGEFKGVRTFAQQLKHVAAANYIGSAAILGEKPPLDAGDETGPDSVTTKAEIMQYLQGSFAYLRKAVATIDEKNNIMPGIPISPQEKSTRLGFAIETLVHAADHYGQMVEYLRMNGIIPPASRAQQTATTH